MFRHQDNPDARFPRSFQQLLARSFRMLRILRVRVHDPSKIFIKTVTRYRSAFLFKA
jgi:hypothetical protein